ncbi:MAG: nuclear transport factor 2 family protein [Pseudomonadota bacterium]|uniref:nuclear transport factor 2 family protein n=1 Tax=Phenylobacterium sp. TaxID=1871053 RepID=UPI002718E279|nr:nuclear transport factor 2 family protein [Phenylobacterium sp.]MDO9430827.1 nuclear transport factor 2 family protein [Phenylobacterium sp.]
MTTPQDAIRARRKLTNKIIAAHDAGRLAPFFDSQVNLISGEGGLLMGAQAVLAAFQAQFADPSFVTYARITESVTLDAEGQRAAETGTWVATWKDATSSGPYLAVWKKSVGQWVIESETFVTLA